MTTQLQRQGVAQKVNATLPNGSYFELMYHHGLDQWGYNLTQYRKSNNPGWADVVCSCTWHRLLANNLDDAIQESAHELGICFEPEIEAYCYSNKKTIELWPHVADDVYITCATYEPLTDTVRHEPSNVCLIDFTGPDSMTGRQYPSDAANRKYAEQIEKALDPFNSNVAAHGKADQRKEWLAWLVGQYIRDLEGEKPIKTQSIRRESEYERFYVEV